MESLKLKIKQMQKAWAENSDGDSCLEEEWEE